MMPLRLLVKTVPLFLLTCSLMLVPNAVQAQDRITPAQTRALKQIESGIQRAGRLYENNRLSQSARTITDLAADLESLLKDEPSPALIAAAQEVHSQLRQARTALVNAGETVPSIKDLPDPAVDPDAPVSFTREVAAILNSRCGNCHVQRAQGQFSMATYNRLAQGVGGAPVVVPGKAGESRIIEAIEEGSMPPSGDGIPDAELARLKKWIQDGAEFDGEDRDAMIAGMSQPNRPRNVEITRPVGTETISFSVDIAPILMDNCMGCHFEAQNVRGGLRMNNFIQLLRGGDSGPLVRAGDGENSLLVQRLTATDNTRMPQRRRPLDKAVIDKIVKWIDEGARFDGRTGQMNLRQVNAIAAAEAATHEELTTQRQEGVLRNWNKVMSNMEHQTASGTEVYVIGSTDNDMLDSIAEFGDSVSQKIKSRLFLNKDRPLVKGQVSVFVFDRRYDYSEFGKMVETRELPKSWTSHWGFDTVDAYLAVMTNKAALNDLKPELTQRLASVATAALGADIPEWFADGLGYVVAEQLVADSAVIKEWQSQSTEAIANMNSPTDFMQGRLANDRSGLVAYAFVKMLAETDPNEFRRFLENLGRGEPFEETFATSWSAPPVELMRRQFGGGGRNNRPGRNRRGR